MTSSQLQSDRIPEVIYPESDGQPMADNTIQFRWIMIIFYNLEWLFGDRPDVFIAGDLFWYPLEGHLEIKHAPDVMVVFGRPKGDRGSYKQWEEENIPPQVVFEILSPSNTKTEMDKKWKFYNRYGVEEYYLYDPYKNELTVWWRSQGSLKVIQPQPTHPHPLPGEESGGMGYVSPRLQISFVLSADDLQLYRPDGERFATYSQIRVRLQEKQQQLEQTEQTLELERREKETALQQVQQTRQELELERRKKEDALQQIQRLQELLSAAGINPDTMG